MISEIAELSMDRCLSMQRSVFSDCPPSIPYFALFVKVDLRYTKESL